MEAPLEIDVAAAARLIQTAPGPVMVLDVREPHELAICALAGSKTIPIGEIAGRLAELPRDRPILVLCHHGSRSRRVTQFLRASGYPLVSNITGGIEAWAETIEPGMPRY